MPAFAVIQLIRIFLFIFGNKVDTIIHDNEYFIYINITIDDDKISIIINMNSLLSIKIFITIILLKNPINGGKPPIEIIEIQIDILVKIFLLLIIIWFKFNILLISNSFVSIHIIKV